MKTNLMGIILIIFLMTNLHGQSQTYTPCKNR